MVVILSSLLIFLTSLYSAILFHTLVEFFSVSIALGIFVVTWFSRKHTRNLFLMLLGIGYFFVGIFDLIHLLTYENLNLINLPENISMNVWMLSRYIEAASFVVAVLLFRKIKNNISSKIKNKSYLIFSIYLWVFVILSILLYGVYYFNINIPYIYINYLIIFAFLFSLILLPRKKLTIDKEMIDLIVLSLVMKIVSLIILTIDIDNGVFHSSLSLLARFVSSVLLYKVFLVTAIISPYEFLFSDLKKSEARYKSLVEFSPDAILVHSQGRILYANGPSKKLFRVSSKESMVGSMIYDFFHPKYKDTIKSRINSMYSEGKKRVPEIEMEIVQADGKMIPVESKSEKINYEGKTAIESIIHDISRRKKAQRKIQKLARFTEENPHPVISASKDGKIKYLNIPARRMFRRFGAGASDFLPEDLMRVVAKMNAEDMRRFELEMVAPSANIFHITLYANKKNKEVHLYATDMTKRRKAEKKLLKTQARLRRQAEKQLLESHKYLGTMNRKISMLLELKSHSSGSLEKQDVLNYIVGAIFKLTSAEAAFLYRQTGKNHFSLISSVSLSERDYDDISIINTSEAKFLKKIINEKTRVSGGVDIIDPGCFRTVSHIRYLVSLPVMIDGELKGFILLLFSDREGMDKDDLKFLDVFAMHTGEAIKSIKAFE
jgi:PAS domain S-box-containing protein